MYIYIIYILYTYVYSIYMYLCYIHNIIHNVNNNNIDRSLCFPKIKFKNVKIF